jgi:hypothetical protein
VLIAGINEALHTYRDKTIDLDRLHGAWLDKPKDIATEKVQDAI